MYSVSVPAPAIADAKTDLNQFCQKHCRRPVTKQDIVYVVNRFGDEFQSIVKLNCFEGQEYAGHLCMNAKEAEKSAAHQALLAYGPAVEALPQVKEKKSKRKPQPRTPEEFAERRAWQAEEGENPAITPKTKLNSLCMKVAKRYLHKGETIYQAVSVAGGFQATVRLTALPGDWAERCWAGEVCSTKQKAEQSAAAIALQQIEADPELSAGTEQPKGKGKGKSTKGSKSYNGWVWQPSSPDQLRERVGELPMLGEVLAWKGHYGWLKPMAPVDHPLADLREGKIYVNKSDLPDGVVELPVGATVQFNLYGDNSGLGGEHVTIL
mmetsp:Transcript_49880/g.143580  ORF Transcript_49880/g.143580 Transcript_49880/m.143580 type:complete len:323 (+) Transcript_49880:59-1027(+)